MANVGITVEGEGGGGLSASQVAAYSSRPLRSGGTFYYSSPVVAGANTVLTQNNLYAMPFLVPVTTTFTSIGVVTVGVALSNARLGIYSDTSGVPNALVLDAGSVATTAGAFATIAINQALQAGWYWLACAVQGAAGNLFSSSANSAVDGVPVTAPFSTGPVSGYLQGGISGALPTPWGATKTDSATNPIVFIAPQ